MDYDRLSRRHHEWVVAMGWTQSSILEATGMICSEIGEASLEFMAKGVCEDFYTEIADVVLRSFNLCERIGVGAPYHGRFDANTSWNAPLTEQLLVLTGMQAHMVNAARKNDHVALAQSLHGVMRTCYLLLASQGQDLLQYLERKIEINIENGSRGRSI